MNDKATTTSPAQPYRQENRPIGLWGQRHLRYIKEHCNTVYTSLQLSGKLNNYLSDIDQQARLDTIIQQMVQTQGIIEELKFVNQMALAGRMNHIQASAMEIVKQEIIYA